VGKTKNRVNRARTGRRKISTQRLICATEKGPGRDTHRTREKPRKKRECRKSESRKAKKKKESGDWIRGGRGIGEKREAPGTLRIEARGECWQGVNSRNGGVGHSTGGEPKAPRLKNTGDFHQPTGREKANGQPGKSEGEGDGEPARVTKTI